MVWPNERLIYEGLPLVLEKEEKEWLHLNETYITVQHAGPRINE